MKSFLLVLILFFFNTVFAGELHGPHNHGEMELLILWEGNTLQIILVGTAQDLIGYEGDPQTARQKKALRKFDEKYDPFEMIKISPESNCEFLQGRSKSDMFTAMPHKDGLFGKTHSHKIGTQGHIDFMMHYDYQCSSAPEITLEIFKLAPSIKKVNVHKDVIDGDIITTLTKENNHIIIE